MTVPQLMETLGVSRTFAYRLVADGTIPAIRIGNAVRVPAAGVQAFIDKQLAARKQTAGANEASEAGARVPPAKTPDGRGLAATR